MGTTEQGLGGGSPMLGHPVPVRTAHPTEFRAARFQLPTSRPNRRARQSRRREIKQMWHFTRLLHKLLCIGARNVSVQGVFRTLTGSAQVHSQ